MEITLGIGGENLPVRFLHASLVLQPPPDREGAAPITWETEVGFIDQWRAPWQVLVGQVGFFDHFTVSMHRHALAVALEPYERFDERFGVRLMEAESRERFTP